MFYIAIYLPLEMIEKYLHTEDVTNIVYERVDEPAMSNYELLEGLRCWDNEAISYIYYNYYSRIEEYVLKNRGNTEDVKDVFHEAVLVLNKKLNQEKLELEKDLYYYFFGVCRRIWLNKLKEKSREESYDDSNYLKGMNGVEGSDIFIDISTDAEKEKLLKYHLSKLDKDNRKIIELRFDKVPYKKIAEIMNFKSEQQARDKKHYSVELLTKSIKSDRRFSELIEN
jgi:RNA polymerase sigma factor (sigma-70 family)